MGLHLQLSIYHLQACSARHKDRPQDQLKKRLGPPMILLFAAPLSIRVMRGRFDIKRTQTSMISVLRCEHFDTRALSIAMP